MDEQNAKDKLTINIILAYLSVLSAREQLNIAQKQAEASQKKVDLLVKEQAQTARIQLRLAIFHDFVNLNADYTTYKLLLSQVEDFGQSFHAAEIRYTNGAISTVDFVIAKNNFDRVQLNLVVAKYNYMLPTKLLDFYQNRPLW